MTATAEVRKDAGHRALRTFLQGLAFDVVAGVVVLLLPLVSSAESLTELDWSVVLLLVLKSVLVSGLSYVARVLKIAPGTTQG